MICGLVFKNFNAFFINFSGPIQITYQAPPTQDTSIMQNGFQTFGKNSESEEVENNENVNQNNVGSPTFSIPSVPTTEIFENLNSNLFVQLFFKNFLTKFRHSASRRK